jgi:hypothetical protein
MSEFRYRPVTSGTGEGRTYHVVYPGVGVLGLVTRSTDGAGWVPVSLSRDVKVAGPARTRDQAARRLARALVARIVARRGRTSRRGKVVTA